LGSIPGRSRRLFSKMSRYALGPTQPPIQLAPEVVALRVNWLQCESDTHQHLLPRLKMGKAVHPPLQTFLNIQGQLDHYLYNGLVPGDFIAIKCSEFSAIL
jgi:hypothetical protein